MTTPPAAPPTAPPHGPPGSPLDGPPTAEAEHSSRGDVIAGGIFVGFGVAFCVPAVGYGLGSFQEMGAGMFPFLVGLLMAALGVGVVAAGLKGGELTPGLSRLPWRGIAFVTAALVWFAFTVPFLGFLPATAGTVLLSCLASPTTSVVKALGATVGVSAACHLIFVVLLRLPIPMLGG